MWAEVSKKMEGAGSKEGVAALSAELKALKVRESESFCLSFFLPVFLYVWVMHTSLCRWVYQNTLRLLARRSRTVPIRLNIYRGRRS